MGAGRTCLDGAHRANLDTGKGFEQAEGPWHAATGAGQVGAPSGAAEESSDCDPD